jgi:hypothetical protein
LLTKPTFGFEYIPEVGTIPKELIMNKLQEGILKRLQESGSTYVGGRNSDGLKDG